MKKMSQALALTCAVLCLALVLAEDVRAMQGDDLKAAAARYLAAHEPELQQTTDPRQRRFLLLYMAPAALSAGEAGKAAAYAQELMALGEQLKSTPGFGPSIYGDATHVGNLVLGHLALAGGDVGKAREHLLAAGRVPGSSVLKSFGPNMLLAKELIGKGEREAVIEYLDLCAKFWAGEGGRLGRWKEIVRQGGTPDFGMNLGTALTNWRRAR